MRVAELSLRNYRVFEEVDLELPARVIGIFGANGSGKTTLMEAIAFALYGADAARTKKQEIRTTGILADCEVRLAFEHAGRRYEIRRSLTGRGHAPDAELFGGDLVIASGTTEVDAEIQRLLRMDLRVFRASAFAEQKQLDAFSDVTAGRRKEMALRLLGIRPVDEARTMARRESRASREHADRLAGAVADTAALEGAVKEAKDAAAEAQARAKQGAAELKAATVGAKAATKAFEEAERVRERVDRLSALADQAREQLASLAEDGAVLAERLAELRTAVQELPVLEERLAALAGVRERLEAARELTKNAAKASALEVRMAKLPDADASEALAALEAAERGLRRAEDAASQAEARNQHAADQVAAAEERLRRAGDADPTQPCPTCGQELGVGFTAYVRHCRQEVAAAKKAVSASGRMLREAQAARRAAERAFRAAEATGRTVQEAAVARAGVLEQLEELRHLVASLATRFKGRPADVDALEAEAGEADAIGRRVAGLQADRKHLVRAEADLETNRRRALEGSDAVAKLEAEVGGLAFDPEQHARLREERDASGATLEASAAAERRAADAFADADKDLRELSGRLAEARELEQRTTELRSEARHLERVTMLLDGFRDNLVSRIGPELSREAEALFRELTGREYDDLRIDEESLAIQIADGDAYHPIERFSGSEADLANLALRVAISTHLSRVSGADVGWMVLDEVLGSLDEERKDLMVQTLGRLVGRFHQLFVITHADRVKDQFPALIQVTKVGRRRSQAVLV